MSKLEMIIKLQDYLYQKMFEPNKLCDEAIEELCLDFYTNFIYMNKSRKFWYPVPPNVKIIKELTWWSPSGDNRNASTGYSNFSKYYFRKIDKELNLSYNDTHIIPFIDPLDVTGYYGGLINRNNNFGGIARYAIENFRLFYIDFAHRELSKESQIFWQWYKRSFDVVAMYYDSEINTCYVIKKPDEWIIKKEKMFYRYGKNERFFIKKIEVDKQKYENNIYPVDIKTKKKNIDDYIKLGEISIIDSYKNYPENNVWKKSEFILVNLIKFYPKLYNIGFLRVPALCKKRNGKYYIIPVELNLVIKNLSEILYANGDTKSPHNNAKYKHLTRTWEKSFYD